MPAMLQLMKLCVIGFALAVQGSTGKLFYIIFKRFCFQLKIDVMIKNPCDKVNKFNMDFD